MYNKLRAAVWSLNRTQHSVTTKVALINDANNKVLMTIMPRGNYGLPGGHVDKLEAPDDALRRELFEELGLKEGDYTSIVRRDFIRDKTSDRIILLYTGRLAEDTTLVLDPKEIVDTRWVSIQDFEEGTAPQGRYTGYIKEVLGELHP